MDQGPEQVAPMEPCLEPFLHKKSQENLLQLLVMVNKQETLLMLLMLLQP